MRYKEPKSMKEIHEIRAKHYERTKDMSIKERVRATYRIVDEILKERNLKHLSVREKRD